MSRPHLRLVPGTGATPADAPPRPARSRFPFPDRRRPVRIDEAHGVLNAVALAVFIVWPILILIGVLWG